MELRKDYLLDRYVYFASERKERPHQFKKQEITEQGMCYFCKGNEHLTPAEKGRIAQGKSWKMRWFENKFPLANMEGEPKLKTDNRFFTSAHAYGLHEVIVESPKHEQQLWDLSKQDLAQLLKLYQQRISDLSKKEGIRYVQVFKNHGRDGGASLVHTHTQVAALAIIPPAVREEIKACKRFPQCPYCEIVNREKKSERRCFENRTMVAFTPYASRFNDEVWLFPKRHTKSLAVCNNQEYSDCAELLHNVLKKLKSINAAYNFLLHYAPEKEDLHFHIEITPRIAIWAGFETATGCVINSVMPEDAAAWYRGEKGTVSQPRE
ncbi:DUF4931 domain-containing protein [Candidatus Woesearchaeota archaeon]|nr:DUF4931 domain-containing protein [Candidatus Woesearchaeota archaeon]